MIASDEMGSGHLWVLESGYGFTVSILPDGRRHISDLFGPGAICNWTTFRAPKVRMNFMFVGGSNVNLLDGEELVAAFREQPQLQATIGRHEMARTLRTAQRTRALIALPGPDRMMTLLLDFRSEAGAAGLPKDPVRIPLRQGELGEFIGQTEVHVSRVLKSLKESDRIATWRDGFEILDPESEIRRLDYVDPFASGLHG
ncbi:hypothetical protein B5C34_00520 [Pacificimonas flava]|uniref:HTH crp-type domain-containing protein n=3 Tax=Pacificimonas TaxID=1960290 RepID=A0A219B1L1_9SPHN|nr:hypothetical protein B5C34_00520 [Pacificimonas flava]